MLATHTRDEMHSDFEDLGGGKMYAVFGSLQRERQYLNRGKSKFAFLSVVHLCEFQAIERMKTT